MIHWDAASFLRFFPDWKNHFCSALVRSWGRSNEHWTAAGVCVKPIKGLQRDPSGWAWQLGWTHAHLAPRENESWGKRIALPLMQPPRDSPGTPAGTGSPQGMPLGLSSSWQQRARKQVRIRARWLLIQPGVSTPPGCLGLRTSGTSEHEAFCVKSRKSAGWIRTSWSS